MKEFILTNKAREGIRHVVLILLAIVFIFPFYWLVSTSVKPETEMFRQPPIIIPLHFDFSRYGKLPTYLPFFRFMTNSFIISASCIIGFLFSCPLAAYAFSRLRWKGRNTIFAIVLATMMLPGQVTLIPLYLVYKKMGFLGTWLPLILPTFFGSAFFIFLLRQFFLTLPKELEDAAKIDGAGYIKIYWRIMIPQITPALITVAIFTFMNSWNDFMGPLIYINKVNNMPLALGLQLFKSQHNAEYALMMAAAAVMTIPPVLVFLFLQRFFIEGITLTGIKG